MSLMKQLKRAFPNLKFESDNQRQIWFGKWRRAYKIISFEKDGCIHGIYKLRNFYLVSIYGTKNDSIVPLKESYKIFQILARFFQ